MQPAEYPDSVRRVVSVPVQEEPCLASALAEHQLAAAQLEVVPAPDRCQFVAALHLEQAVCFALVGHRQRWQVVLVVVASLQALVVEWALEAAFDPLVVGEPVPGLVVLAARVPQEPPVVLPVPVAPDFGRYAARAVQAGRLCWAAARVDGEVAMPDWAWAVSPVVHRIAQAEKMKHSWGLPISAVAPKAVIQ